MRLRIPPDKVRALTSALAKAGGREIGGQLYGEQLAPSDFRATELTFQARPGTFARFIVDIVQAVRDAVRFFDRTQHRYARFNYIGEWHSHPRFPVQPSIVDRRAMRDLVMDREFRGNFALLLIARLDGDNLTLGAWLFDPLGNEDVAQLAVER